MDTQQQSEMGMVIGYNSNFDPFSKMSHILFQTGQYLITKEILVM